LLGLRRTPGRSGSVSTDVVFAAPPEDVWRAIVFYEEIEHDPPLMLRLTLPRALRSEGRKDAVGSLVRCRYAKGHLVKRMTEVDHGRLLAFDVVEQDLRVAAGVGLLGGGYVLEPLAGRRTRVTLTTRYVSRPLHPERLWVALEERLVHAFHRHVLEGMKRKLQPLPPEPRAIALPAAPR
jgi:hypothetical protein